MKKVILSCLKMNLKISHKLRQPICLKYLKMGVEQKRGERWDKDFKKGRGQAESRGGCLKKWGTWNLLMNYVRS